MADKKRKLIGLFVELLECGKDDASGLHILIKDNDDKSIGRIYGDADILVYYIINKKVPDDGFISYELNDEKFDFHYVRGYDKEKQAIPNDIIEILEAQVNRVKYGR